MLTINWPAFLPDLALMLSAFAAGSVFGGWMARRDYARDLALLQTLVPEPGPLDRMAALVETHILTWPQDPRRELAQEQAQQLRALAARIEAAGTGAVSVPPAWEQTPTWRET